MANAVARWRPPKGTPATRSNGTNRPRRRPSSALRLLHDQLGRAPEHLRHPQQHLHVNVDRRVPGAAAQGEVAKPHATLPVQLLGQPQIAYVDNNHRRVSTLASLQDGTPRRGLPARCLVLARCGGGRGARASPPGPLSNIWRGGGGPGPGTRPGPGLRPRIGVRGMLSRNDGGTGPPVRAGLRDQSARLLMNSTSAFTVSGWLIAS